MVECNQISQSVTSPPSFAIRVNASIVFKHTKDLIDAIFLYKYLQNISYQNCWSSLSPRCRLYELEAGRQALWVGKQGPDSLT